MFLRLSLHLICVIEELVMSFLVEISVVKLKLHVLALQL